MSVKEQTDLYTSAFSFYKQGNYCVSETLFRSLCLQSPLEEPFWKGLAASLQLQEKWQEALQAWAIVALLAEKDPMPHFHAAECFFSLKQMDQVFKALETASCYADSELLEKIELLKQQI